VVFVFQCYLFYLSTSLTEMMLSMASRPLVFIVACIFLSLDFVGYYKKRQSYKIPNCEIKLVISQHRHIHNNADGPACSCKHHLDSTLLRHTEAALFVTVCVTPGASIDERRPEGRGQHLVSPRRGDNLVRARQISNGAVL